MKKVFCTLREIMDDRGVNIKSLQATTLLSRTTISNLINLHSSGIQFDTLALLCDALNCTPADLLVVHDIKLKFSIQEELIYDTEDVGDDDREGILESKINCILSFDGEFNEITFNSESTFFINTEGLYSGMNEISPSVRFDQFLSKNNFPSYIKKYILDELNSYIENHLFVMDFKK